MRLEIIFLSLILLLSACSSTQSDNLIVSDPVVFEVNQMLEESFEIRFNDGAFEPSTIEVTKGTYVKLIFDNDYSFVMPVFNIAEDVKASSSIEFLADKKGKFTFFCEKCESKAIGLLVIN